MEKSYKYIVDNEVLCIVREERDEKYLSYDAWSSRSLEWRPSEVAAGVFAGFEDGIWENISEQDVNKVIYDITQKKDRKTRRASFRYLVEIETTNLQDILYTKHTRKSFSLSKAPRTSKTFIQKTGS